MVPLLLVAHIPSEFESYISEFTNKEKFSQYNIYRLIPAKSELSLDEMKELKRELVTASMGKRLMVIYSFDTATTEAQNSLLKTLEDRVDGVQFLLCVSNPERVLPTIRSRSKTVSIGKYKVKRMLHSAEALINEVLSAQSYSFLSSPLITGADKDSAGMILDEVSLVLRSKLSGKQTSEAVESLKLLLQLRSRIEDNNLNVQLALDYLLIFIHKTFTMKGRT